MATMCLAARRTSSYLGKGGREGGKEGEVRNKSDRRVDDTDYHK